jgi:hypothetical protein
MTLHLSWIDGGEAEVVETDGDRVLMRSTRSAPPGSPLRATVSIEGLIAVSVKVHGCKKAEGGAFMIHGRWVNLTKEVRAQILKHA